MTKRRRYHEFVVRAHDFVSEFSAKELRSIAQAAHAKGHHEYADVAMAVAELDIAQDSAKVRSAPSPGLFDPSELEKHLLNQDVFPRVSDLFRFARHFMKIDAGNRPSRKRAASVVMRGLSLASEKDRRAFLTELGKLTGNNGSFVDRWSAVISEL